MFDLQNYDKFLTPEMLQYYFNLALTILSVLLILIIGYYLAGVFQRWVVRRTERSKKVDPTVGGFLGLAVRYTIIIITLVAVLQQFGVETTSIIALLGAAGLAVALALQNTLSNIAAGVMLVSFRPFRVGHYIDAASVSGTVREIGLFATELVTIDNVKIVVPNNQLWEGTITNYSAFPKRRVDLTFGVGYGSDLKTAEQALRAAIAAERGGAGRIIDDPAAPFVAVTNLGDSSVDFQIRVWCKSEDYWALRFHLLRDVKERLDAAGVEIPFPSRTVYTHPSAAAAE